MLLGLDLDLSQKSATPAYRALATKLMAMIENGSLQEGAALPPTRELAKFLGVSRDTIIRSYEELIACGVAETRNTSGTYVGGRNLPATSVRPAPAVSKPAGKVSSYSERLTNYKRVHATSAHQASLNFGAPPINRLPIAKWRELLIKHCRLSTKKVYRSDSLGRIELRQFLAEYLRRSKGIECKAEQIVIWSQTQNALNLLCRILLDSDDLVAVEEPGFGGVRNICAAQGLGLRPIDVDQDGLRVSQLTELKEPIKLAYVTPAHHDPTGAVLSTERRHLLLNWAVQQGAWIIEDDYDGTFSFGKKVPPSLTSIDRHGHVIYMSSFWKVLYPLTPVGFTVLPPSLVDLVAKAKELAEPNSQAIEHLALAEYLKSGQFEKHLRRVQKTYAAQRRALIYHLKQSFGTAIDIAAGSAGNHQMVKLRSSIADDLVVNMGLAAGLGIGSTRNFYMTAENKGEFLIDFSGLPEQEAAISVRKFKALLQQFSPL